jgi:hypothetical protein
MTLTNIIFSVFSLIELSSKNISYSLKIFFHSIVALLFNKSRKKDDFYVFPILSFASHTENKTNIIKKCILQFRVFRRKKFDKNRTLYFYLQRFLFLATTRRSCLLSYQPGKRKEEKKCPISM